ncbi:MAG: hypothetical protein IKV57_05155 [Clostridia bacterium]|nr:hypothetical protein [Clostridia bacterium]
MKKIWILLAAAGILTGCGSSADIGIIGGADGPTSILVGTQKETETLSEMPVLNGIPVPPGTFAEGWKGTEADDGSMYLKTIAVSEAAFRLYTEETMGNAGYTLIYPEIVGDVTEDRVDSILCDGEAYTVQLLYAYAEETLTVIITPKA